MGNLQDSRRICRMGDIVGTIFVKMQSTSKNRYNMMKHFKTSGLLPKHANALKVVTLGRFVLFLKSLLFCKSVLEFSFWSYFKKKLEKAYYG